MPLDEENKVYKNEWTLNDGTYTLTVINNEQSSLNNHHCVFSEFGHICVNFGTD